MQNIADKIIKFNTSLNFTDKLPEEVSIMNPFKESQNTLEVSSAFYRKYYNDNNSRHLILGINPGRFGAGLTGIPFTDSIRLKERCHIDNYTGPRTFELSSVFVYDVIEAYGGEEKFYRDFYINSICPLGFTTTGKKGNEINCNYYDTSNLLSSTYPFIVKMLKKQLQIGVEKDVCICLGTGKNHDFLVKLNKEHHFFDKIIPLEHPRFIMQYKTKHKQAYIDKYINTLKQISEQ